MDIKYTAFKCVDWVDLAQYRGKGLAFANTVMNLMFPYNARNALSI
jgi:hypothetical protein